jgi:catechol 2,3-dioxygenase-like lactoylglutathione lyase family enzyme
MKPMGINRIVLAVRDLEKAKALYSSMLGATFYDASWTGAPLGMEVAISWDAGIEICAPMPGREKDSLISGFLDQHGDGILTIVFGVQDADAVNKRAEQLGIQALHSVDYSQADIDAHLDGLFKKYKEHFMNSAEACGFTAALAQIERK